MEQKMGDWQLADQTSRQAANGRVKKKPNENGLVESGYAKNDEGRFLQDSDISKGFFYLLNKRFLDILFSALALVLLSPLFLILAIVIWIDDPAGSSIYSQTRIGKDGNPFRMYKFRSMHVNADQQKAELLSQNEVTGAMFKMKEDPRTTRVGKFIRKYSLDELPQLFNVLIGNMTLIGPRPPLVSEVEEYTAYDKQRLLVKPGVTGLWQVSGRNKIGFKEMVELDLRYIQHRSTFKDFKIALKTVKIMIIPNDAY